MITIILVTLFACANKPAQEIENANNTQEVASLIEFEGVNNIILVNADGAKIDAKKAQEGTYQAFAVITGVDSNGSREIELAIEDITLSKERPIVVRCKMEKVEENSARINCTVADQ